MVKKQKNKNAQSLGSAHVAVRLVFCASAPGFSFVVSGALLPQPNVLELPLPPQPGYAGGGLRRLKRHAS